MQNNQKGILYALPWVKGYKGPVAKIVRIAALPFVIYYVVLWKTIVK